MTMPKTLAALPSSQYATLLELVSGQLLLLLLLVLSAVPFAAASAIEASAAAMLLRSGWVDFHRACCLSSDVRRGATHEQVAGETRCCRPQLRERLEDGRHGPVGGAEGRGRRAVGSSVARLFSLGGWGGSTGAAVGGPLT